MTEPKDVYEDSSFDQFLMALLFICELPYSVMESLFWFTALLVSIPYAMSIDTDASRRYSPANA